MQRAVDTTEAPSKAVGLVIALIVLLPETVAAVRAAAINRLQSSLNLALGSAIATIGLTLPAVALIAILKDLPPKGGLAPLEMALLAGTLLVASLILASGRATVLQGCTLSCSSGFSFFRSGVDARSAYRISLETLAR